MMESKGGLKRKRAASAAEDPWQRVLITAGFGIFGDETPEQRRAMEPERAENKPGHRGLDPRSLARNLQGRPARGGTGAGGLCHLEAGRY
jgi:hypothetical protein